ncbi:hypothetical protein JW906_04915 [bacterium]|nr:hypothetical protein [bacterium]
MIFETSMNPPSNQCIQDHIIKGKMQGKKWVLVFSFWGDPEERPLPYGKGAANRDGMEEFACL